MKFRHRQSKAFPLTQVVAIFPRTGGCLDPVESRGLGRVTGRMLMTGAGGLSQKEFNAKLERLGASTGISVSNDHCTLRLVSLTENLDAALDLAESALRRPNLEQDEFTRLQDELHSQWISDREEHKQIRAQEVYLERIYRGRPTGYPSDGTGAGLRNVTLDAVRAHCPRLFGDGEPVIGVLSDLSETEARERVAHRFENLPRAANGQAYPWDGFTPETPEGREVVIVPDAETQTDELVAGVFSAGEGGPDWHIHRLISLVFGGDMNSRLFRILRGERGYSYGASCWYESSRGHSPRGAVSPFTLYTFPTSEHTAEALPLLIELYEELVAGGVTADELERAKQALIHSHAFMRDTPQKALSLDCEEALYGIATDDEAANREKMEAVTEADVARVLKDTHHPDRLSFVMLGDPARLEPLAAGISGVRDVRTVVYPPPQ